MNCTKCGNHAVVRNGKGRCINWGHIFELTLQQQAEEAAKKQNVQTQTELIPQLELNPS